MLPSFKNKELLLLNLCPKHSLGMLINSLNTQLKPNHTQTHIKVKDCRGLSKKSLFAPILPPLGFEHQMKCKMAFPLQFSKIAYEN